MISVIGGNSAVQVNRILKQSGPSLDPFGTDVATLQQTPAPPPPPGQKPDPKPPDSGADQALQVVMVIGGIVAFVACANAVGPCDPFTGSAFCH